MALSWPARALSGMRGARAILYDEIISAFKKTPREGNGRSQSRSRGGDRNCQASWPFVAPIKQHCHRQKMSPCLRGIAAVYGVMSAPSWKAHLHNVHSLRRAWAFRNGWDVSPWEAPLLQLRSKLLVHASQAGNATLNAYIPRPSGEGTMGGSMRRI